MVTNSYRTLFLLVFAFFASLNSFSQSNNPKYDKAMADSLGGDDYGMKKYVLVILKTGSSTETNKKIIDSLFTGHMQNINRLAKSGKLVIAGPLVKNEKNYRGIFILNVATVEEAQKLVDLDPAVHEKLLDVEMYQWYGSAAISEYLKAHEKIEKKKF
jgi:uncharacterized protein YciI